MINRWLKKMNEPVPIDAFPSSWGDWAFLIIALALAVVLSVWSDARAQPELKVGQEVEVSFLDGLSRIGRVVSVRPTSPEGGMGVFSIISTQRYEMPMNTISGYRILKPAPRPEFKLSCIENKGKVPVELPCERPTHLQYSIEAIADELRYLRGLVGATQGAGHEAE